MVISGRQRFVTVPASLDRSASSPLRNRLRLATPQSTLWDQSDRGRGGRLARAQCPSGAAFRAVRVLPRAPPRARRRPVRRRVTSPHIPTDLPVPLVLGSPPVSLSASLAATARPDARRVRISMSCGPDGPDRTLQSASPQLTPRICPHSEDDRSRRGAHPALLCVVETQRSIMEAQVSAAGSHNLAVRETPSTGFLRPSLRTDAQWSRHPRGLPP
jgi:hypothetical protein